MNEVGKNIDYFKLLHCHFNELQNCKITKRMNEHIFIRVINTCH